MKKIIGVISFALLGYSNLAWTASVTLNVLEWEGYISPYTADFEKYAKNHGVDVNLNIIKPFITNPDQIYQAVRQKTADVVTPTNNYYKMDGEKLIKTLHAVDFSKLTNYNKILVSLRKSTYDYSEGAKFSVPLLGGAYGLAYNSDTIKTAPDSWNILWKPEASKKYSVTNDQFEANCYLAMLLAGYPPNSFYNLDNMTIDQDKVQNILNGLVKNAHNFWGGMEEAKVMKELNYVTTYGFEVAAANKEGQHWKFATPKEGQTLWLDTLAISKSLEAEPEKLKAAYLLLDFMISEETQLKLLKDYGIVIVNTQTASLVTPEEAKAAFIGDESFFKEDFFWKPLTSRTRGIYKSMWDKAKESAGIK